MCGRTWGKFRCHSNIFNILSIWLHNTGCFFESLLICITSLKVHYIKFCSIISSLRFRIYIFLQLTGLKSEQFRRTSNETDDNEHVDRYEVLLGHRKNYILHFMISFFSFVLFGIVPPLVYGFSFTKSNDRDFKLAAVAGASLLCIIILAIGKAYIQRQNRWDVYIKTVASYVVIAAGAGGFSFLAGAFIDKLVEKYGWFEQSPAVNLSLPLPEMSLAKPAWGSSWEIGSDQIWS